MPHNAIIYFDIAAVVVMSISLACFLLQQITKDAANRVYLTALILVTITSAIALTGELFDSFVGPVLGSLGPSIQGFAHIARSLLAIAYYSLRSSMAPAYLILIATISGTTYLLNSKTSVKIAMWTPMVLVLLVILSNPAHHLVFTIDNGVLQRGPFVQVLYTEALYYSIAGVLWLARWRSLFSANELTTLALLYPIMLAVTVIQCFVPELRLEMFVTSIAMMLISVFVIHPETRHDTTVDAASLHSYNEMLKRAFATEKPLCLVYVEVVDMQKLRELAGKTELQEIIRTISRTLSATLERDDMLYYLQNGTFCISSRNIDPEHALAVARRTHEEGLAKSNPAHEESRTIALRSCVVRVPEDAPNRETLRSFGKRYAHFVPTSSVTTLEELSKRDDYELQMALSGIIARAIEARSFEVYYQPIYCLKDGKFHSAEALVRLNDPVFGWISPAFFIPEAEQSGTIIDIGNILLQKICAFLAEIDYESTQLDYVEVNLSVDQCIRPEMATELLHLIMAYGIEPSRMNLEITETSAAYSQQAIETNMRILAETGITLSLDDYGTGYSNITRILDLPISLVKIDKSFVDGLDDNATKTVLADTISTMKSIGKDVLIEGVETREQKEALEAMGADYIQGYYFAKPLPQSEFITFLQTHNN